MNNNRGFTLVEVLISIIILGVIITGFFQFFLFSQKTTTCNQEKLVAINIAQTVLEQIKEDAHTDGDPVQKSPYWLISHPAAAVDYPANYGPYPKSVDGQQYTVKVAVGEKLDNGLQMVTVFVLWDDDKFKSTVKGLVDL